MQNFSQSYENLDRQSALYHLILREERERVKAKSEKLGSIAFAAALLAGIASTFIGQVSIPDKTDTFPEWTLVLFGVTCTLSIACHLVSLVLASLISIAIYNFDCAKAVYQARDDALAKAAPFLPTLPSAPLPLPGQSTTSLAMAATPTSTFEDFWRSRCQPDFVLSYRLFQGGLAAFMFAVTLTAFVQFRVSAVTGIVTAIVCLVVLLWMLMCVTPRWGAAATAAAGPSHPLHPLRFHPGMTEPLSESAQLLARVPPLPATLSPYIPVASSSSSSPSSATSLSQSAPRRLVGRSSSNSSSASRGHDR